MKVSPSHASINRLNAQQIFNDSKLPLVVNAQGALPIDLIPPTLPNAAAGDLRNGQAWLLEHIQQWRCTFSVKGFWTSDCAEDALTPIREGAGGQNDPSGSGCGPAPGAVVLTTVCAVCGREALFCFFHKRLFLRPAPQHAFGFVYY